MESWLVDVKRVRIPRPKFGGKRPAEPPKDYAEECAGDGGGRRGGCARAGRGDDTDELRRSLQEKL